MNNARNRCTQGSRDASGEWGLTQRISYRFLNLRRPQIGFPKARQRPHFPRGRLGVWVVADQHHLDVGVRLPRLRHEVDALLVVAAEAELAVEEDEVDAFAADAVELIRVITGADVGG